MSLLPQKTLPVPEFKTRTEAFIWMYEKVNDPCIDNHRFAYNDDHAAMLLYNHLQNEGCCGSFDREVKVDGRLATVGCNYGH